MIDKYNYINKYLKEKFGERTLKICIDAGFTCPNRDGTKSSTGCIFCSKQGSGEHIEKFILNNSNKTFFENNSLENQIKNIKFQIDTYFNSYKAKRANKFIAYFQNFTNTYDTIQNLKLKYDSVLEYKKIVGLDIATRPDCINEDICKLLASYKEKIDVWVELGLQTSSDSTGKFINRCYSSLDFSNAVKLLNKYNIDIVTHIMIGLPNENFEDLKNTVNFLNLHNIQGLKIHSTYITKNTVLERMYNKNEYNPITLDSYIESACYVLTHISPKIIIHKLSGDAPKDLLVAPEWNKHKKWIINGIDKYMKINNLYQGKYYL